MHETQSGLARATVYRHGLKYATMVAVSKASGEKDLFVSTKAMKAASNTVELWRRPSSVTSCGVLANSVRGVRYKLLRGVGCYTLQEQARESSQLRLRHTHATDLSCDVGGPVEADRGKENSRT